MTLPGVQVKFLQGGLGQSAVTNDDGVILAVGACSNGVPNEVYPIVDPNTITTMLGYGPLAELTAQILNNTSTTVYATPAPRTAGSVGTVTQSRLGGPALSIIPLFGLPGTPFAATYSNVGTGQLFFSTTSTAQSGITYASGSVTVTTPGALGTAEATVVIGSTTTTNVVLTSAAFASGVSGVTLSAFLPTSGAFVVGDQFTAVATASDSFAVDVAVTTVNTNGQSQFTYSLDNGSLVQGPSPFYSDTVTSSGNTPPVLTLTGTAPATNHVVTVTTTQSGTAYGPTIQSPNAGVMVNSGAGLATGTVTGVGTSGSEGFTSIANFQLTVTTGGALTTAAGSLTINGVPSTQSSTPFTLLTIPSTWTDDATGITLAFSTSPGNFVLGNVYTIAVQPQAEFTVTVDGTPTTGFFLPATGIVTTTVSGPVLTLAHTHSDLYTFSATNPSSTTSYTVYVFPLQSFQPKQRNGQSVGIQFNFAYGVYQAGDSFTCAVTGPSVSNSDTENALAAGIATPGTSFSLIGLVTGPATWSTAGNLAASVNSTAAGLAVSPKWTFVNATVCGPDLPSSGTGSTSNTGTTAYITSTGALDLEFTEIGCGADYLLSPLTGNTDLRNGGVGYIARIAANAVQVDPGAVNLGGLSNVVSTTTPAADASVFYSNRGMVSVTYNGLQGVFCAKGVTLARSGSDYNTVSNRRVINKVATFGRAALLPYTNTNVNTVPGKGTLSATSAAAINGNVQGQITANCTGAFQSVSVACSTTTNILSNGGIEPVTITAVPFATLTEIDVSIGFAI